MSFSPRKGDRVESIRWPGIHGSVTNRAGKRVFVHWDGTSFDDEAALDELKPSRRRTPWVQGPDRCVARGNRRGA